MRVFATYTNEFVTVTPTATDILLYNRFRSGTTSALRLSWQWDKRDNRLFPTRGFFQSVSAELAPPVLAPTGLFGNQVNLFTRYSLDSRLYHPLFWGIVARAKLSAGYIKSWDESHPIPVSEFYYLGGINSVRGYRLLSISPTTPAGALPRPDAPLSDPEHPGLALSLFKSVGFGFRWFSPIGPLRFEWGIPLDRRRDRLTGAYIDQALDFQFTIGNFF
jgi:outer membrane protein insertion porin family